MSEENNKVEDWPDGFMRVKLSSKWGVFYHDILSTDGMIGARESAHKCIDVLIDATIGHKNKGNI